MIDKKKTLPSFCTSNFDVLKSAVIFAKLNNLPILIESTSNQVNQFGGYTSLKPHQFYKKINGIAAKLNYRKNLIIGADHLGPLPWKNMGEKKAIENSIKLFKNIVNTGYDKIHIDTGIKIKGDQTLFKKMIYDRCKIIYDSIDKNKLHKVFFVFGTEVPIAGGSKIYKSKITSMKSIILDFKFYKQIKNSFSLVVEPGLGFTNKKIYPLKMNFFQKKKNFSLKNDFTYEAHSTDFQNLKSLKKLVNNNFKFLKVGPELTYYFMKAILQIEKIEKFVYKKNFSNIKKIISKEMDRDKSNWIKYYFGNKTDIEYLKFNSYLDRSRYYWNKKNVINSLDKLKKNINLINEDIILKIMKIPKNRLLLKNKLKLNNFNFIVLHFLMPSLSKYYKACKFNLDKKYQ